MLISQRYQEPSIVTRRCLANNNPKDFPNTRYGITLSNYYRGHRHHYQEDFYVFPKMRLKKYLKSWPNICQGELFDRALDLMPQTSSLSRRKMGNYVQYKTTVLLINGQRKIAMYPH